MKAMNTMLNQFLTQVDRLVESENTRQEEKKEEEYKPVVMGELFVNFIQTSVTE